jgi:hypothetical protein
MTTRTVTLIALALVSATSSATVGAAPGSPTARHVGWTSTSVTPGPPSFEVKDEHVVVRRDLLLGRSMTTLSSGTEQVILTIDRQGITVTTPAGRRSASLARPEGITAVVESLQGRQVVKDATELLRRRHFDEQTPEGRAFTLTRALLESVAGDNAGTLEVVGWTHASRPAPGPKAVLAAVGSDPASCWDAYAHDAIRAAGDYVDCYNNTSWYDVIDRIGCSVLYDIEAEGDWLWYMNCVGLPFPIVRMG